MSAENRDRYERYDRLSRIGSGAYGDVWLARDRLNKDKMIALKMMRLTSQEDGIPPHVIREVALLKKLASYNHDNVVKLLDVCTNNADKLYLIFEHIEQDLATYLSRAPPSGLSSSLIKHIMCQLLDGISFIHANVIQHRDLKPQNVLITNSGQVKIADFGLARMYKPNALQTSLVVTLWYRSPEVILAEGYASPVDVWSAGCIFAELIQREPLFKGNSEQSQLVKILEKIGTPPEADWPEGTKLEYRCFKGYQKVDFHTKLFPEMESDAIDLMEQMLTFNPEKRITARDALEHAYFAPKQETPALLLPSTYSTDTSNHTIAISNTTTSTTPNSPKIATINTPNLNLTNTTNTNNTPDTNSTIATNNNTPNTTNTFVDTSYWQW